MNAIVALLVCSLTFVPISASAARPPAFTPVVPDAAPAVSYDPALVSRVGITYARYHFDFSRAFAHAPGAPPAPDPSRSDLRRLNLRFSSAVDDAVRERIIATLSSGDASRATELQKLFANDDFLDHATEAIRVFGLQETDLSGVIGALVIAGYNASHPVALTAPQGLGIASDIRTALLASPVLPALDDATKQTIATEMSYQVLFWEFDASLFGAGQNPVAFARLHESIAASLGAIGIPLSAIRPSDTGIEIMATAKPIAR